MDVLKIMETAIRAEVEAKALYLRGEQAAATEDARALFRRLAAEEERHRELLLDLYQKLAGKAYAEAEW
ncbi:MAG TPA: ferritin family protein [Armatimonadota bacterium]|jgi:rubrerythrin|nr:ferritin family protein [Armatimonadota bacterium]